MNERIDSLVTGANGFVGGWLVDALLSAGETVVGLGLVADGAAPSRIGASALAGGDDGEWIYRAPGAEWTLLSRALDEPDAAAEVLERFRPRVVYHLAGQSSAAQSFDDPAGTFRANLGGTLNLLEAVRPLPADERPRIVAAGSAEEYGRPAGDAPLTERAPLRPISPYGVSKAAQSLLCLQYHAAFAVPVVVSRAFSHTGPGHDARFVFPSFARQVAAIERGEQEPVLRVGDLGARRDFMHVRDAVDAYRLLAERGLPGQVYNVCSGRSLSIREGLDRLLAAASVPVTVEKDPERFRPADIPCLVGDATKLRRVTGWRPVSGIEQALDELLAQAREDIG